MHAIKYAVNYSSELVDLFRAGVVAPDLLKCPAWSDVIVASQAVLDSYVHFPLRVGAGCGDALDSETGLRADWARVDMLMEQTGTPIINLHLEPFAGELAGILPDALDARSARAVAESFVRDVAGVLNRYGPERVIVENDYSCAYAAAILPDVIGRVVEETGCGFLLDLSHAQLAADRLGEDRRVYTSSLPVTAIGEIHVSGNQHLTGEWLERVRQAGALTGWIAGCEGKVIDHLPMTVSDWEFVRWALENVRVGAWRAPRVVAFEYGGIGAWFSAVTDAGVLREQVPRLHALVDGVQLDAVRSSGHAQSASAGCCGSPI